MINSAENRSFRVAEIPAEIRAAERYQHRRDNYYSRAECNKQPVKCRSSRIFFLRASCKFITSSFSHITFSSSASCFATFSPSSVLTGVSSASNKDVSISESGTDNPCFHLDTVCRTTFSLTASSSCESSFDFLLQAFSFSNKKKMSNRGKYISFNYSA